MKVRELNFKSGIYSIRQLLENEASLYKSMRLEAIQTEPAMSDVPFRRKLTLPMRNGWSG